MDRPDLLPCSGMPGDGGEVLRIGWLNPSQPFPRGETSVEFQEKLHRLVRHPVRQTRGIYRCPFCRSRGAASGSAEIRVSGVGAVYAAPTLIHHYVVAHGYQPPEEFILAVLAVP